MARHPSSHFTPSVVTLFRERWSSSAGAWLEEARNLTRCRRPSFPMSFPVRRSTSDFTPCFSSSAHSAFTPLALSPFSDRSTVPALKRVRPPDGAPLPGRAATRRRSIQRHHSARPSSPRPTSAMEMASRCGCPGFAASMVQRAAHSGCSSRSATSLAPALRSGPGAGLATPAGVNGAWTFGMRCSGGGPCGCLGESLALEGAAPFAVGTPGADRFGGSCPFSCSA
mmetsp:Transcript_14964/g.41392  ORF Transcript_14964/g.41392 Transcript_14964/m.41392 type:complete len:226 (+) Transcript_14964:1200-1877(+)